MIAEFYLKAVSDGISQLGEILEFRRGGVSSFKTMKFYHLRAAEFYV